MNTEEQIAAFRRSYDALRTEIGKVIVGHDEIVEGTLVALFSGGHVLLEGVPGLGKTLLVRTLSQVLDLSFNRIQFTPDLMPADILGTNLVMEGPTGRREFQFQKGPVFAHLLLADEINRATPKTQSALLEAMQEHQVTAGGEIRRLSEPFFVMATQNPIDQEGTYPLPEAQLDRFFFKVLVGYPTANELNEVLTRTTSGTKAEVAKVLERDSLMELMKLVREVPVASHVKDYAVRLVLATHPRTETAAPIANQYLRFGSSPRGGQTLLLAGKVRALTEGRFNVSFEDIQAVAAPTLRHRLILNFEAEAEGITTDHIIRQILNEVPKMAETVGARPNAPAHDHSVARQPALHRPPNSAGCLDLEEHQKASDPTTANDDRGSERAKFEYRSRKPHADTCPHGPVRFHSHNPRRGRSQCDHRVTAQWRSGP